MKLKSLLKCSILGTAMIVNPPLISAPAMAADNVEVMHWWTAGGEARRLMF